MFRSFQDEDLPSAVLRAVGTRLMLDAKIISSQGLFFGNKSSQPAAVAFERQQEVKVGSKSYPARARKFEAQVPNNMPFQDKLKNSTALKSCHQKTHIHALRFLGLAL